MHQRGGRQWLVGPAVLLVGLAIAFSRSSSDADELFVVVSERAIGQVSEKDLKDEPLWKSPGEKHSLYVSHPEQGNWVCPRNTNSKRQPLCRQFSSRVVAACRNGDDFLIVTSDGDVHRVNYALMNADGRFAPLYHHTKDLEIVDAWLPASQCIRGSELPAILAVSRNNSLLRFDRTTWQRLD